MQQHRVKMKQDCLIKKVEQVKTHKYLESKYQVVNIKLHF